MKASKGMVQYVCPEGIRRMKSQLGQEGVLGLTSMVGGSSAPSEPDPQQSRQEEGRPLTSRWMLGEAWIGFRQNHYILHILIADMHLKA